MGQGRGYSRGRRNGGAGRKHGWGVIGVMEECERGGGRRMPMWGEGGVASLFLLCHSDAPRPPPCHLEDAVPEREKGTRKANE